MYSPFKARLQKGLQSSCKGSYRQLKESAIERPPTSDVSAFDLYSRAKNLTLDKTLGSKGEENLLQGADLLNQAVARDPSFFDAYCQLA